VAIERLYDQVNVFRPEQQKYPFILRLKKLAARYRTVRALNKDLIITAPIIQKYLLLTPCATQREA
jgi:hypothetical protein